MSKHSSFCKSPICAGDKNPNYKHEVIWYAGESVCTKTPYQKFQNKQLAINKEVKRGTFKNIYRPYTAHALETKSI